MPIASYFVGAAMVFTMAAPSGAQIIAPSRPSGLADSSVADRTAQFREQALGAITPRAYVPSLVGRTMPQPVTVQGFGQTIVAGSVVANPGLAGGSVVDARCPLLGSGRVIVANNLIVNGGRVVPGSSGGGVTVIDCRNAMPGSSVSVTGNTIISR